MVMVTRLKVHEEYADIDLKDLGYLYIVWDFVLKYYNGGSTKKLDAFSGSCSVKGRKQNGFDRVVNLTERMTGYYWPYKPEVTFSVPVGRSDIVPVPHLIDDRKAKKREEKEAQSFIDKIGRKIGLLDKTTQGKNRRHTRWKCSAPVLPGAERKRPDLIIVKDYHIRWPGRETLAYGEKYDNNLKRLVEMKYGPDRFNNDQKEAYIKMMMRAIPKGCTNFHRNSSQPSVSRKKICCLKSGSSHGWLLLKVSPSISCLKNSLIGKVWKRYIIPKLPRKFSKTLLGWKDSVNLRVQKMVYAGWVMTERS